MTSNPTRPAPAPGRLEVAREENAVLMRVIGLGNMNISLTMVDFVKTSLTDGYTHFALDLAQCQGMDSTFMGTIVALDQRVRRAKGWLCLLNVSEENRKLLELLGVWGLVPIRERFPIQAVETEHLELGGDAKRRLAHIRRAHEHLLAVDERNRERFGHFLSGLEEEMRSRSARPDKPAPPSPEA